MRGAGADQVSINFSQNRLLKHLDFVWTIRSVNETKLRCLVQIKLFELDVQFFLTIVVEVKVFYY